MRKRPYDGDDPHHSKRTVNDKTGEDKVIKDKEPTEDKTTDDEVIKALDGIADIVTKDGYTCSIINWIGYDHKYWRRYTEKIFVNWVHARITLHSVQEHDIDNPRIGPLKAYKILNTFTNDFDDIAQKFDKWIWSAFDTAEAKALLMNQQTERDGEWTWTVSFPIYLIDDVERLNRQLEMDGFGFSLIKHDLYNPTTATTKFDQELDVFVVNANDPLADNIKEALSERAPHYHIGNDCATVVYVYQKR